MLLKVTFPYLMCSVHCFGRSKDLFEGRVTFPKMLIFVVGSCLLLARLGDHSLSVVSDS